MRESRAVAAAGFGRRRIGLFLESVALALFLVAALVFVTGRAKAAQPAGLAVRGPEVAPEAIVKPQAQVFTWALTAPTSWVRTPVTCKAVVTYSDGLQPGTATCEVSTNGGLNWYAGPAVTAAYYPDYATVCMTATNISFPVSSADQNRVRFLINDLSGNHLIVPADTNGFIIRVDNDAPGSPTNFVYNPTWTNINGAFSLAWTNPLDLSGIVKAYYKLNGYPTSNADYTGWAASPGISSLSGLSVPGPGKHSIAVWLEDSTGNVYYNNRNIALDAFWYDPTAPTSNATPTGTLGNNNWYRSNVVVTLSATDPTPGSGIISRFHYKVDTGVWITQSVSGTPGSTYIYQIPPLTTDGQHAVQYRATDGANNLEPAPRLLQVKIDTLRPTTTYTMAGTPGANNWYVSPVTVRLTAADATSGVAATTYRLDGGAEQAGTQLTVESDGAHQVRFRSTDMAGNQEDEQTTPIFRIDTRAPVVTATLSPALPPTGWYSGPVTVTLTASDPDGVGSSGMSSVSYRIGAGSWITVPLASAQTTISTDGLHTFYYRATDQAGNTSALRWRTVKIDRTPPLVKPDWTFDGTSGEGGWYRSPGTVTLYAEDNVGGSGVAQVYHKLGEATEFTAGQSFAVNTEGVHTFRAYAVDAAGNTGPTRIFTDALRIDGTAPTVSLERSTLPNSFGWYSNTVVITVTASDVVTGVLPSGVQAVEYRQGAGSWLPVTGPLTFGSEGQNSYEARARDVAGNVSATRPFTIYLDRTAPSAPMAPVQVAPNTWTATNDFSVTWHNPADLSGIDRVYYTIDTVPDAPGAQPAGCLPVLSAPTRATGIRVPSEGEHLLFLWLVDKAGNANRHNYRAAYNRLLYDATPPVNARETIVGTLDCRGRYYVGPVQIRLSADDAASGVGAFTWITGTTWVTTPVSGPQNEAVVELSGDNKYTLRYKAIDNAGNRQTTERSVGLSIDMTPPGAPLDLLAAPITWSGTPTFTLSWRAPYDFSGVDGGRYTLNRAPALPTEGQFVQATYAGGGRYQASVTVPAEGSYTVYFWLQDSACNNNPQTAVTCTLRYDATPPQTTMERDRPPDHDVWYTRPVTLTFSATDGTGSGVERTYFKVNDGQYQQGNRLVLDRSGLYSVRYYSVDVAGNLEAEHGYQIRVDMTPPTTVVSAPAYSSARSFTVSWSASDVPDGRIAGYWVQYREGSSGTWQPWQNGTTQTSAIFTAAQRGRFYYFRARARDEAGNEGTWPAAPQAVTFVDPLTNGDFASGLEGWQVVKDNPAWQASAVAGQCGDAHAALLGSPNYPNNGVPVGSVSLVQAVDLPTVGPGERLILSFRYRMFTWDVKQGWTSGIVWDTFEADVLDAGGNLLRNLVVDGYMDPDYVPALRDLGCRAVGPVDLTVWQGQRIQLRFSNWNRRTPDYNTYTYLEGIRIHVSAQRSIFLPLVQVGAQPGQSAATQAPPTEEAPATPAPVTVETPVALPPREWPAPDPRL